MKLIITLYLSLCISSISMAQQLKPDENTLSTFKDQPAHLLDTVVISGYSKQQLYSNALNFITSSFKDSRSVVEMKDADLGEIAFKGNVSKAILVSTDTKKGKKTITENYETKLDLYFKCKIYCKDQKFKIVLSSLEYPISELAQDIKFTIRMPKSGDPISERNTGASELALSLIKEISSQINKKPENDF